MRPRKPAILYFAGDSSATVNGQMAAHRRAVQGLTAVREIRATAAAAAAEAARKAAEPTAPNGSK